MAPFADLRFLLRTLFALALTLLLKALFKEELIKLVSGLFIPEDFIRCFEDCANGAPVASIIEGSKIRKTVVEQNDITKHRVFLLRENQWEDSSRLTGRNKMVGSKVEVDGIKCLTCRAECRLLCLDTKLMVIKFSEAKLRLAIFVASIALIFLILLIKYVTKKNPPIHVEGTEMSAWAGLYRFSKTEIDNAMNFSKHRVSLGAGKAGRVYKGILPSGQVVAIKHVYMYDSFTREVECLSRVRHSNLICLLGYCAENKEQYLVYEYCSNGNLDQYLQKKDTTLSWEKRLQILRGCAFAVRFLHSCPDGSIVHRDIKLANILLAENMEPKLSGFGMEESKVFTDVGRVTLCYMDPKFMTSAEMTCASDVYHFGVVALELLSGKKVIELDTDACDQLTAKARDVVNGKRPLADMEDPRLNGNLSINDFESILHVAVLCVARSSKGRPTIDVVFSEIDKAWRNTLAKANPENSPALPLSKSMEIISV